MDQHPPPPTPKGRAFSRLAACHLSAVWTIVLLQIVSDSNLHSQKKRERETSPPVIVGNLIYMVC